MKSTVYPVEKQKRNGRALLGGYDTSKPALGLIEMSAIGNPSGKLLRKIYSDSPSCVYRLSDEGLIRFS